MALIGAYSHAKKIIFRMVKHNLKENEDSKDVFVKDMLFATLDTSLRRARLNNGQDYLLTDTVGFVSKLPTHLVEAFKGTLEEVKYADLLLHVVDSSNEDLDIQIQTTMDILKDLDVLDKPMITVFNKMDKSEKQNMVYDSKYVDDKIFISAYNGTNINELIELVEEKLPQKFKTVTLRIPYDKQQVVNYFMKSYETDSIEHKDDGTYLKLTINLIDYEKYKEFII